MPVAAALAFFFTSIIVACHSQPTRTVGDGEGKIIRAPALDNRRGAIVCPDNESCIMEGSAVQYSGELESIVVSPRDVDVRFYRVEAAGALKPLASGDVLASDTLFTIFLRANRNAYVYLLHRGPSGLVAELIGVSNQLGDRCVDANRMKANQSLELPNPGAYYRLDRDIGTETIQVVISTTPLCASEDVLTIGVDCSAPGLACGEPFIIRHVREV